METVTKVRTKTKVDKARGREEDLTTARQLPGLRRWDLRCGTPQPSPVKISTDSLPENDVTGHNISWAKVKSSH